MMISCPQCQSQYAYPSENLYVCPECDFSWNPDEIDQTSKTNIDDELIVKDSNGNLLQNGDTVMVIKDLPVKGSPRPVKAGTKVKNIRLVYGDHNIDCKIDGFGSMALKSIYVKKA